MALVINHNMMATVSARHLNGSYTNLSKSVHRLSSGLRINSAADDAAGLAIREMMRSDVTTLRQGVRNANDAISMIQTADGALSVIDEKLIRMKELSEQAATGTYTSLQRVIINSEFQAMASEINRIANSTDFNGIKLLDGSLSGEHSGKGLISTGAAKIHFGTGNDSAEDYYYVGIDGARIEDLFSGSGTEVVTDYEHPPVGVTSDVMLGPGNHGTETYSAMLKNGTMAYMDGRNLRIVDPISGAQLFPPLTMPAGGAIEIIALDDGAVMSWLSGDNTIRAQRVNSSGQLVGGQLNLGAGFASNIEAGKNGSYVVTIASGADDITTHIVQANGSVSTSTPTTGTNGQSIVLSSGRVVQTHIVAGNIQGRIMNSDGTSNVVTMAAIPGGVAYDISALDDGSGGFVIATSRVPKGSLTFFNADGTVRSKQDVDGPMTGAGMSVLGLAGGNVAVAWGQLGRPGAVNTGGNNYNSFCQTFRADGTADAVIQIDNIPDGCSPILSPSYGAGGTGGAGFTITYTDHTNTFARTFDLPEIREKPSASINIQTQDEAQRMLSKIDDAVVKKDTIRANLGALQNRLENTISNLTVQAENLQSAESRISDVDVATEMTLFMKNQILTQTAVAMLSQANSMPQIAMQLIGG